ncbi:MAG: ATP-dependent sacrificial sulfur transferase LarE, partial [Candidatus Sumerlaeota bacterium]|nr:ATP-dependent sacrificial sulfur transferase LarE [Candidatus Sumerlaeota bacterium]
MGKEKHESLARRIQEWMQSLDSALVAFSGGVDSGVLLKSAVEALGPGKCLGVTIAGEISPAHEIERARQVAREHQLPLMVLEFSALGSQVFVSNPPDRCYHCKRLIFTRIIEYARSKGFAQVLEGTHRDDLKDHRPGLRALAELGVLSPFKDLGFTKAQIRELARGYGLPNSEDAPAACLASRIPYGLNISREKLARVDAADQFLRTEFNVRQARVRHDGRTAR